VTDREQFDAIIVGGGPAGLSCALWLARYRRTVCVFDTGDPRNKPAWAVHGFPGIPDPPPLELRARIREQAIEAGAVHRVDAVSRIDGERENFTVHLQRSGAVRARRVVLAYGLRDFVPDVPGIHDFYGHSVYHCPDCDGPSVLGQRVGVLGYDKDAAALALYLLTWSDNVTLLTNGMQTDVAKSLLETMREHNVQVRTEEIRKLDGERGRLQNIVFEFEAMQADALFFHLGSEPRCPFASELGCDADKHGYIDVDRGQQTSVSGVYAAGDIVGHPHLASAAAAEGIRAALAIHRSLLPDNFFA
jgi:thioredoxin reductase